MQCLRKSESQNFCDESIPQEAFQFFSDDIIGTIIDQNYVQRTILSILREYFTKHKSLPAETE